MKVTFLGTGTSQGVPIIACECAVCRSGDHRDKRLRSSVMIEVEEKVFVIDTGPDFRQQMLREKVKNLTAIIYTHEHKDHIAGMDDVRAFNYVLKKKVDIYASERVQAALKREFHYVFSEEAYPGIPRINMTTITNEPFSIEGVGFIPIEVMHYQLPVLGFRIGDFTYITDANFLSSKEKEKIKGTKILVLNSLRKSKHISHFTMDEALRLIRELSPERSYLTHISHQLGKHEEVSAELPESIELACDGLSFEL